MSSAVYRNLIKVLDKWSIDSSKKGRDLGEFIRKLIADKFPSGEASQVNVEQWTKTAHFLDEIASDSALKKYPRKLNSTSTGLSAAECKEIVSTDFLKYLNQEEKKGIFKTQK